MKKFNFVAIAILVFCVFTTIVQAADGSYNLAKAGDYDRSNDVKVGSFPSVDLYNTSASSDAELAVSLEEKGFFGGYTFKARQQKWMKNINSDLFVFEKYGKATYRVTTVFNATRDNKAISGYYNILSGVR